MLYYGFEYNDCFDAQNIITAKNLFTRCDDGIHSCMFLIAKLKSYGKNLKSICKSKTPDIFEPNFRDAFLAGLISSKECSYEVDTIIGLS